MLLSQKPSEEYIKYLEEQVARFDRKGLHDTCFHEELDAIRKMDKGVKVKDGEHDL